MSLSGKIANKEIFNFLRTTTIKNAYFAEQSKTAHIRPNIASRVPDNEIPYYRHIAGEYILKRDVTVYVTNPHSGDLEEQIYEASAMLLNTHDEQTVKMANERVYTDITYDEMMYVTSLDTNEKIPFTLENLHAEYAIDPTMVHTKTLEAYKLPSRYYELLCEQYPAQVDLIKAIVYPVKKARAITIEEQDDYTNSGSPLPSISRRRRDYLVNAGNFEILQYDDTLLARNERADLVAKMQSIIKLVTERWNIKEYNFEENYQLVMWALLWNVLPLALIVQRYSNIKTPFVHDSHVWDYLESKGLQSYKGYLTENQTLWLYKNIEYILKNRGKQEVTNLLIDNLLSEVGLNIKAKTIVLDTSDSLDRKTRVVSDSMKTQCETCSKRTWCHKAIEDRNCPDRVAIDDFGRAKPIVLTEEFAGASEQKVMNALINQYGYSEEEARIKYQRSFLWKDDEVEAIKSVYNRDQLTDMKGSTESLDSLVKREYNCGLEPVYNDGVVEEQFTDLRHIKGTYAPTKILEITKNKTNARFYQLFSKFLTETLLHFAPRVIDGKAVRKVTGTYNVTIQSDGNVYVWSYGELLAALYLGQTREFGIEVFFDHIRPSKTDTVFQADQSYFVYMTTDVETRAQEWINPSRLKRLVEGTDYAVGDPITNDVYRWAPKIKNLPDVLIKAEGHEILTNFAQGISYNFPIPDRIRLTTAFKFGKPVKQQDLLDAWYNKDNSYDLYLPLVMTYGAKKVVKLNGIFYGITDTDTPEVEEIWETFPIKLKIVAAIKDGIVYVNHSEIPIIPKYFRWYSQHLHPDSPETVTKWKGVTYFKDGALGGVGEDPEVPPEPIYEPYAVSFDSSKNMAYKLLAVDSHIDIDSLLEGWVDLLENVTDPNTIGQYIDAQFSILEKIYCATAGSGSILTHRAGNAILDAVLLKNVNYDVDLTGTSKLTTWPEDGVSAYKADQVLVATYDDWFRSNKEIKIAIEKIDQNADSEEIWDNFNTSCLKLLLQGCTSSYFNTSLDSTTLAKLRELVIHLSSYKVAFIDVADTERSCYSTIALAKDSSNLNMKTTCYYYIDPIRQSTCHPHIGGFMFNGGGFYYYTTDKRVREGKTYYRAYTETKLSSSNTFPEIDVDADTLVFEPLTGLEVGDSIPDLEYFEYMDFYDLLGITDRTKKLEISYNFANHKWYYRTGVRYEYAAEVPANMGDELYFESVDTFLEIPAVTAEVRKKCGSVKYRKDVTKYGYTWDQYIESDELKTRLDSLVLRFKLRSGRTTISTYCLINQTAKVIEANMLPITNITT